MYVTIAIYLRLSEADGDLGVDHKDESNSIENQRLLLYSYIQNRDDLAGEIKEYVDDGYSGTNFNRPAFMRMIEDAKKGLIQTILVKDLSRLGRDYIVTGDYVEQIFPILGIHFIAVNNRYDSRKNSSGSMSFDMAVSNLINTFYSRDLSKKLRSSNAVRWKKGISTSGQAAFGYRKDPENKGKFVIDPEAADIVRNIFGLSCRGMNTREICDSLNEEGMPTPHTYHKSKGKYSHAEPVTPEAERLWTTEKVGSIIKKYEYTGAMIMGRKRSQTVGAKTGKLQEADKWTVVEDMNPALVSKEDFARAQLAIQKRTASRNTKEKKYALRGKLRCGNCRQCMSYVDVGTVPVFVCRHKARAGKKSNCSGEKYEVSYIDDLVFDVLKSHIKLLKECGLVREKEAKEAIRVSKSQIKNLVVQLEGLKADKLRLYEAYAEGHYTKEAYLHRKQEALRKIEELEKQIKACEDTLVEKADILDHAKEIVEQANGHGKAKKLTRELADVFIRNVYVYSQSQIEIEFIYEDVLGEMMKAEE